MGLRYLRAFCERAVTEQGQPGSLIRFVASTEGIKRDGVSLGSQDWRMENYTRNPVVLWVHDYMGRNLPIGRAVNVNVEGAQLMADIEFDQADDFARQVESKYRRGYLSAVSVGWQDVAENKHIYHDLMDISAVPVPADPQALMVQESRALRTLLTELDGGESGTESDVDVWGGVASAMLALFRNSSTIEDEDRRSLYNVLERAYRKLDREAPEYLSRDELDLLSPAEVDGLFFEGEPSIRAGAVLSTRNRGALEQARDLIQQVLDSAGKEQESKDSESTETAREKDKQRAEEPEQDDLLLTQIHKIFTRSDK